MTILGCLLFARTATVEASSQPGFGLAIVLYGLGALTGLLAEPSFVDSQVSGRGHRRVASEGTAVTVKALVTLGAVLAVSNPLVAFGLGHVAYSLTNVVRYRWAERDDERSASGATEMDRPTLWMAWTLTKQSIVKQVLTEGDKLIVARVCPLTDQGGYAVALNYGASARLYLMHIARRSRSQS